MPSTAPSSDSPTPSEKRRAKAARRSGEFPPAPEPLAVPVFDSHTHLDLTVREAGVPGGADGTTDPIRALLAAAAKNGVDRLVQVGVDVESSRWGADLADRHDAVLAAVALHPNEAPRLADPGTSPRLADPGTSARLAGPGTAPHGSLDEALREIEALAARPRVRGIGETGMDTFRTGDDGRAAQETSFRAHIAIAKRHHKALIIHDRDAHADVLRILDDEGAPDTVVLHCFSGDAGFAAECVRRGYFLSFAGTVTFASAGDLRAAAAVTPPELMMVETDAPYLTPAPHRGRPNASYLIPITVRALAAARGIDVDELCAHISANGERVFGPWS